MLKKYKYLVIRAFQHNYNLTFPAEESTFVFNKNAKSDSNNRK